MANTKSMSEIKVKSIISSCVLETFFLYLSALWGHHRDYLPLHMQSQQVLHSQLQFYLEVLLKRVRIPHIKTHLCSYLIRDFHRMISSI